jgi:two-component system, cell cycle response regulator
MKDESASPDVALEALRQAVATGRRPPLPPAVPGLDDLVDELVEVSRFTLALAQGDLDHHLEHRGMMAGSLKALQAALRHLTWQTQRVAAGDFSQRVDFMGDFSEAFNSMVVALQEANDRLELLATTDTLTGAYSRRKFNELVSGEVERARRYGHSLSLFILDIDHFKLVNDTHGHDAGDIVLRELADIIRAETRSADALARWGGEEFVVLAPGVGDRGCAELAERVRTAVAAHAFSGVGRVTASLGVAEYARGDTPDMLFARADRALYDAKEGGRDRVEVAS